jgi:RNA polymerase sigma factor (sigma-70 family)
MHLNPNVQFEPNFIEKLKGRDRASFEQLYDSYSPALYGITLRMTNSEVLSEDVLQDAFVKIWNNLSSYDSAKGTIFTWMLNITRNTAIELYAVAMLDPHTSLATKSTRLLKKEAHSQLILPPLA